MFPKAQIIADGDATTSALEITFITHEEGRFRPNGSEMIYEYNLTDHLGNTRITFGDSDADGDADILQEDHYYPFGMLMTMTSSPSAAPPNDYLYNGKELQTELGLDWYDYGARMYDASIGRWNGVDALAEKYLAWSPYNYVMGNPLLFVDPNGDSVRVGISSIPTGTAMIRLIGSEYVDGAPREIEVPTYTMYVSDDVNNTVSEYTVTRDGPVIAGVNQDGTFRVVNTTFEPEKGASEGEYFIGLDTYNYAAEGDIAITLSNPDGSRNLEAKENEYAERETPNVAKGVSVHVGGAYTNADGNPRVTGSLGCFTLAGPNSGNQGILDFRQDVNSRAASNREAGKSGAIRIGILQRPNEDVNLKFDVSSSGKTIRVLQTQ